MAFSEDMPDAPPNDFRLLAFFLADHAEAINGKLYVHGGYWNRLASPSFPLVMAALTVVAMIEVPATKYQSDHRLAIQLEDADGRPLGMRVDGEFRVGAGPDMEVGEPTTIPLAMPIRGMSFERAGRYTLTLDIDGGPLGRYSVRVDQAT